MPPKRKKAASKAKTPATKKTKAASSTTKAKKTASDNVTAQLKVLQHQLDHKEVIEDGVSKLLNLVIPVLSDHTEQCCNLAAYILSQECTNHPVSRALVETLPEKLWEALVRHLFVADTVKDWQLALHCFDILFTCEITRPYLQSHLQDLYLWMPPHMKELHLRRRNMDVNKNKKETKQHTPFVVTMIGYLLEIMEGEQLLPRPSPRPETTIETDAAPDNETGGSDDLNDEENAEGLGGDYEDEGVQGTDSRPELTLEEATKPQPEATNVDESALHSAHVTELWLTLHRGLEVLCDILADDQYRTTLIEYLEATHWNVRTQHVMGRSTFSTASPHMLLTQQLLERLQKWCHGFPSHAETGQSYTRLERRAIYHQRASTFQKFCQRYHSDALQDIVYAGVGLLCNPPDRAGTSFLRQSLACLDEGDLGKLLRQMRLVSGDEHENTRDFLLGVLEDHLVIPVDPLDELQNHPLYPTEADLWDFSRTPPSHTALLHSPVLSLPKLQTSFLNFADYLWRNFELIKLESAYEIRSDLCNAIKKLKPVLRQLYESNDASGITLTTDFTGWSRMALEVSSKLELVKVNKPTLGDRYPSQVVAEISIDLAKCGESIRREWDGLGEFDNLFLVSIDASKMSGLPAATYPDYSRIVGSDPPSTSRRAPDEDDSTFPSRFGVTLVRGCMILSVKDSAGTVLSDPSNETKADGTKRIFMVALDPTQFTRDQKLPGGTSLYDSLNVVVRRHGKVNNFRSVLETIRGLMKGRGSVDRTIPTWLQQVVMGQGEPDQATYTSETVKAYARARAGVANPDAFLDYGDTFLDEAHLRSSFADISKQISVDGQKKVSKGESRARCNYRVRVVESSKCKATVDAVSYPFPQGCNGNAVSFTKPQVQAIRSGLSPGLSLVVGPPGTGKTDVAVQIIASLYHSFPSQRTVIVTHSNAALNDIFQKVMARGDVEERYMLRLGAGEKELQTESSHDFTKLGRVAFSFGRRGVLLEEVQRLSESLGISGRAERGADGTSAYTCETAAYFLKLQIQKRIQKFEKHHSEAGVDEEEDVTDSFPFRSYCKLEDKKVSLSEARKHLRRIREMFSELAEYRPLELLRTQRQRSDYLIMKQTRIVAMTCTHAAIARSNLLKLGFEYDNIVIEEAGQMLEIESFIPFLLQRGGLDGTTARIKRITLLGDHNQLPPVIQNMAFAKYSSLDQSLFARFIRRGVPYVQLDQQGRARPEIAKLYSWRYKNLGDLGHVHEKPYDVANPGFAHTFQLINVEDYEGRGETCPTPYFFQNIGEAEYAVALFQYMVLIGYSPTKISILTTYNGQKALIQDILEKRCGEGTALNVKPRVVSTVDQYQGQQNDMILLSLVRTNHVGHLRDVRRLIVAVSRARLGLFVLCRQRVFADCYELKPTMDLLCQRPTKLELVIGESMPSERKIDGKIPEEQFFEVEDVGVMGQIVHQMQESLLETD